MDQTWSNVIVFLGATIVLPIAIGLIARWLWFRREDDDYGDTESLRRNVLGRRRKMKP